MRIANQFQTAQPLSDGSILPAGQTVEVDDYVGADAVARGAVLEVDQPASSFETPDDEEGPS